METMSQVEGRSNILVQDENGGLKSVAKQAEEIFGKLDTDNDNELTMEEFVSGYLKMNNHKDSGGPSGSSKSRNGAKKSSRRNGRKF